MVNGLTRNSTSGRLGRGRRKREERDIEGVMEKEQQQNHYLREGQEMERKGGRGGRREWLVCMISPRDKAMQGYHSQEQGKSEMPHAGLKTAAYMYVHMYILRCRGSLVNKAQ